MHDNEGDRDREPERSSGQDPSSLWNRDGIIRHGFLLSALLALVVVWAPLPFGSVTPNSSIALAILLFLLLAASPWLGDDAPLEPAARRGAAALFAVAALGIVQTIALPAAFVRSLSPETFKYATESAALAGAASPEWMPLSLAPEASRAAAIDWAAAGAALVVAARCCRRRRARRLVLLALFGSALFQVFYGAQQWFLRAHTIWGVETPNQALRLRGSFVNPNHLALYLEIALAVAFARLLWGLRRASREKEPESQLLRGAPVALVFLAIFAGVAFTGSRAGLLAAVAGLVTQAALSGSRRERRGIATIAGLVVAGAFAFVAATGFREALGRIVGGSLQGVTADVRFAAIGATAELAARFPVLGVGLGAFRAAFPLVQPPGVAEVWWHAHCDWIELPATAGIVGALLVGFGLVAVVRGILRTLRTGARGEDRAAGVAALGALAAVAVHSIFDFGLTLPANAVTLAVVCGAALAARRAPPMPKAPDDTAADADATAPPLSS